MSKSIRSSEANPTSIEGAPNVRDPSISSNPTPTSNVINRFNKSNNNNNNNNNNSQNSSLNSLQPTPGGTSLAPPSSSLSGGTPHHRNSNVKGLIAAHQQHQQHSTKAPSEVYFTLPIENWLKFSNTLNGRDKIYRLIQYLTRFLMYSYSKQPGHEKDILDRIAKLSLATGMTRKLLRAGKSLDHFQNMLKARFTIQDDPIRVTAMCKSFGLGCWLIFDFFQWLHTTGVYVLSADALNKVNQRAASFWLASLIAGWLQNLYAFRINWMRMDMAMRVEDAKPEVVGNSTYEVARKTVQLLKKERDQIIRDWLTTTADIFIPTNTLGVIPTNLGVVGLAGTFSSLMAIYSLWPSSSAAASGPHF